MADMKDWMRRVAGELKIGDIIEMRFFEMRGAFAQNVWKPAQVVEIDRNAIAVRIIGGENKWRWLPLDQRGALWR